MAFCYLSPLSPFVPTFLFSSYMLFVFHCALSTTIKSFPLAVWASNRLLCRNHQRGTPVFLLQMFSFLAGLIDRSRPRREALVPDILHTASSENPLVNGLLALSRLCSDSLITFHGLLLFFIFPLLLSTSSFQPSCLSLFFFPSLSTGADARMTCTPLRLSKHTCIHILKHRYDA